ncbi:MAG: hypothetical protein PHI16_06565, partial [Methanocellales archaeon]|nr:hypothetical protein [Methanocellales archaeon]
NPVDLGPIIGYSYYDISKTLNYSAKTTNASGTITKRDNPNASEVGYCGEETGTVYAGIAAGGGEKGTAQWYEVTVVNPTDHAINVTDVDVVCTGNPMFIAISVAENPTTGWDMNWGNSFWWNGSAIRIEPHDCFNFRVKVNTNNKGFDARLIYTISDDGGSFTTIQRTSEVIGWDDGESQTVIVWNLPGNTVEQAAASPAHGLYMKLNTTSTGANLSAGQTYTFTVNWIQTLAELLNAGGVFNITIPEGWTNVTLVNDDFGGVNVTGNAEDGWLIQDANTPGISPAAAQTFHITFNATTPTGYTTVKHYRFNTSADYTDLDGDQYAFMEAVVQVQADPAAVNQIHRYYNKFNLSGIPSNAEIVNANLILYVNASTAATGQVGLGEVYHANGTFTSETANATIHNGTAPSFCPESRPFVNFSMGRGSKVISVTTAVNESFVNNAGFVAFQIREKDENATEFMVNNSYLSVTYRMANPNSMNVTWNVSGLTQGEYEVRIYANSTKNTKVNYSESHNITIDGVAPNVTAITLGVWTANNSVVTLNASINDGLSGVKNATVNVSLINSTFNEAILNEQSGDYWTNTTIIADRGDTGGLVNLTITAHDNASNCNNTINMAVGIDANPPSVTAITVDQWYVNNSVVTLNASITDDLSGVKNATVNVSAINSTLNEVVLVKQAGDYWTNTTIVADRGDTGGLQNLTITAYDNVSNVNNTINMTVGIDDNAPTITIDEPTTSSPVYRKSGEQFYVNFTYTEENPANYTVNIYNSTAIINTTTVNYPAGGTDQIANESFYLNSSAAEGWYNVSVEMYDNVSNYNISYQNNSVVKDETMPVVGTPTSPTSGYYSTNLVNVNVTVTDAVSGVSLVYAQFLNGSGVQLNQQLTSEAGGWFNYTTNVSSIADGNYTVSINATDNTENWNNGTTVAD